MNFRFSILDFGLGTAIRKAFFRNESGCENNIESKIQNLKSDDPAESIGKRDKVIR